MAIFNSYVSLPEGKVLNVIWHFGTKSLGRLISSGSIGNRLIFRTLALVGYVGCFAPLFRQIYQPLYAAKNVGFLAGLVNIEICLKNHDMIELI